MANDNKELVSSMLRKMTKLNYIKPGDVPGINLYMDQVTTFKIGRASCRERV